jgi:SAM-dependent methyltransferase
MTRLRTKVKQDVIMKCLVCSSSDVILEKEGINLKDVSSKDFSITDKGYGKFLSVFKCKICGFLFCPDGTKVEDFYTSMQDSGYEDSRHPRALQAQKLLKTLLGFKKRPQTLLDIGAGSGILVGEANSLGLEAEGLEPCSWLVKEASKRDIKIHHGTLENYKTLKKYEAITCIDVIEHVADPVRLLKDMHKMLEDNGVALIVTPDVNSLARKIFKWRWWHFRIAHISYFTKSNLSMILKKEGFVVRGWKRPTWYFSISYLIERASCYLPILSYLSKIKFLEKIVVPLNLRDSWLVIVQKI